MPLRPSPRHVPEVLTTSRFALRPLRVDDVEADYAAVMDSRVALRSWEGGDWPADDFTLAQNRVDLERHEREHEAGDAYTFTMLAPDGATCLGCVYLFDRTDRKVAARRETVLDDGAIDAGPLVGFWVRTGHTADGLEEALVDALLPWLRKVWGFASPLFVTGAAFTRQINLLTERGFRPAIRFDDTARGVATIAFLPPA